MADTELVEALADCLEAMRQGEHELATCLERYSAHRAELQALLDVARLIQPLPPDIEPSPAFRARTRRLLAEPPNGGPPHASGSDWQPAGPR